MRHSVIFRLIALTYAVTRMALCLGFQGTTTTCFRVPMHHALQEGDADDQGMDIIARRIIVKGDINGGYVRTCVLNEV